MEDFVTFEIAKKLKEKGFMEKCFLHYEATGGVYSNSIDTYDRPNQELDYSDFLKCHNGGNSIGLIDRPTIPQVLKWLREEKKYHIEFVGNACGYLFIVSDVPSEGGTDRYCSDYSGPNDGGTWDNFEDCAIAGIEYVLDNLI